LQLDRDERGLNISMMTNPSDPTPAASEFTSFWHGPLDPITYTCLASFVFQGAALRLYSYDRNLDVPDGVELADARQIVADERLASRFVVDGRVSFSKFSNYFRYRLLQQADTCWVDADLLCLRKPNFAGDPVVVGYQFKADGPWALNGAVLKLPRTHPILADLCERAALAIDHDTGWGVIGPLLVTEMARKHQIIGQARPLADFYPLQFDKFWKALLPGYYGHMVKVTTTSTFLHLWHEYYTRSGYEKDIAPAEGSFLYEWCERLGTIGRFRRVYRREELRHALGSYVDDRWA
jgi:hypothetical protein